MTNQSALEKNRIFSNKTSQGLKNPEIPKMILGLIPSSKKILDLGCGEGGMIRAILNKFSQKEIIGVDISPRRIELLRKKFPKHKFLCEDVNKTSLKKNEFDLIICTQVIEHVENDKKLIDEIYRILKIRGKLYITSVIKNPWAIYKYRNNNKFVLDPTHEREYSSEQEFISLFRERLKLIKIKKNPVKRKLFFEIRIPGYYTVDTLWEKI